ncbi:DUF6247 family protein [Actinacidiphila oryziradicis]|uniref:Uncharacterized protein n=1 Tax=Actinacidiphila oryziradicis TaxID=2571141 RepID=A0A4U0RKQ6_9ACTN|nr:DUF6247 family protein [Actinacidiphila oryziradicis]TJZ95856.1 hypothetical protein FCI23_51715 [Actinacidiphila oryziradicis]
MSAQPDHAPVPPYVPAPGAPAELLAQLRADRRAAQWVPAFERDWAKALEESKRTYRLTVLYEVVHTWQSRINSAPAVDAFIDSGMDESGFVALEDALGKGR